MVRNRLTQPRFLSFRRLLTPSFATLGLSKTDPVQKRFSGSKPGRAAIDKFYPDNY
jgi:hypothetical protein